MWYIPVLIVVLAAGAVAGVSRHNQRKQPAGAGTGTVSVVSLSMDEINLLLARLEKEEAPEIVQGAMCYRVAGPPSVAEYTCPVCREKTIYEDHHTEFIEYRLGTARRLAESIDASTEFNVILDESRFCAFCTQDTTEDACLVLMVQTEKGEEISNIVSVTDLRMLDSFLKGELYWETETDSRIPLRDNADRMRSLLGFSSE